MSSSSDDDISSNDDQNANKSQKQRNEIEILKGFTKNSQSCSLVPYGATEAQMDALLKKHNVFFHLKRILTTSTLMKMDTQNYMEYKKKNRFTKIQLILIRDIRVRLKARNRKRNYRSRTRSSINPQPISRSTKVYNSKVDINKGAGGFFPSYRKMYAGKMVDSHRDMNVKKARIEELPPSKVQSKYFCKICERKFESWPDYSKDRDTHMNTEITLKIKNLLDLKKKLDHGKTSIHRTNTSKSEYYIDNSRPSTSKNQPIRERSSSRTNSNDEPDDRRQPLATKTGRKNGELQIIPTSKTNVEKPKQIAKKTIVANARVQRAQKSPFFPELSTTDPENSSPSDSSQSSSDSEETDEENIRIKSKQKTLRKPTRKVIIDDLSDEDEENQQREKNRTLNAEKTLLSHLKNVSFETRNGQDKNVDTLAQTSAQTLVQNNGGHAQILTSQHQDEANPNFQEENQLSTPPKNILDLGEIVKKTQAIESFSRLLNEEISRQPVETSTCIEIITINSDEEDSDEEEDADQKRPIEIITIDSDDNDAIQTESDDDIILVNYVDKNQDSSTRQIHGASLMNQDLLNDLCMTPSEKDDLTSCLNISEQEIIVLNDEVEILDDINDRRNLPTHDCTVCREKFDSIGELEDHKKMHWKHMCKECGEKFEIFSHLEFHLYFNHPL